MLEVDVSRRLGRFAIDAMFTADRGITILFGRSGAGKSSVVNMIGGLLRPDRGRIAVDGIELSDDLRNIQEVRREVGMVFQSFNLFPHLTVLENVTLAPRHVRRRPRREA